MKYVKENTYKIPVFRNNDPNYISEMMNGNFKSTTTKIQAAGLGGFYFSTDINLHLKLYKQSHGVFVYLLEMEEREEYDTDATSNNLRKSKASPHNSFVHVLNGGVLSKEYVWNSNDGFVSGKLFS